MHQVMTNFCNLTIVSPRKRKTFPIPNIALNFFEPNTENGQITFANTVKVQERLHPNGIQLNSDAEIAVTCVFDDSAEILSRAYITTSKIQTEGTQGSGIFAFEANYYADETFSQISDSNDIKIVGERLFFGISPTTLIDGIFYYITDCVISDEDNRSFAVIQNQCAFAGLTPNVGSFLTKNLFTLEYSSFTFNSKSTLLISRFVI